MVVVASQRFRRSFASDDPRLCLFYFLEKKRGKRMKIRKLSLTLRVRGTRAAREAKRGCGVENGGMRTAEKSHSVGWFPSIIFKV